MTLHVFDETLNYVGRLESYQSMTWSEEYHGLGAFTLILPDSAANAHLLRHGYTLYRSDRKACMMIVSVVRSTEQMQITCSGYTALCYLSRRVVKDKVTITAVEDGLYSMVGANLRDLPDISCAAAKGLTDEIEEQEFEGVQLTDAITDCCDLAEMGARVTFTAYAPRGYVFEIYKGQDLSYQDGKGYVMCEEYGNLIDLTITQDSDNFCNVAFVEGANLQEEPNDREIITVGTATGRDRREIYLASGLTQEAAQEATDDEPAKDAETDEDFRKRLVAYGEKTLLDYYMAESFEAKIDPADLGKKFDLGDLITCKSRKYGLQMPLRIQSFTDIFESGARQTTITLGYKPNNYVKGEILKNG